LIKLFILLFPLLLYSFNLRAKESYNLDSILNQIQSKYDKVNDFSSKFTQEATVRALNKVQSANGEVWFKKPGKMRWNYYRPTKDEIVSDGSTLWFYNEEQNQVIESTLRETVDTPNTTTLLSGLGNIKKLFNSRIPDVKPDNDIDGYIIELTPREESEDYNKAIIAVDKKTLLVSTIYLFDPFGNLTKVRLKDIEINKGISDSLFKFKAPNGAEIVKVPSSARQ
jgi:outer membrane lipoprotein carrier protein